MQIDIIVVLVVYIDKKWEESVGLIQHQRGCAKIFIFFFLYGNGIFL